MATNDSTALELADALLPDAAKLSAVARALTGLITDSFTGLATDTPKGRELGDVATLAYLLRDMVEDLESRLRTVAVGG